MRQDKVLFLKKTAGSSYKCSWSYFRVQTGSFHIALGQRVIVLFVHRAHFALEAYLKLVVFFITHTKETNL